jgi:hypothetical protein
MHIFWVNLNQENCLHSCNFSHVKYFQMSEILKHPSLLFSNNIPRYRGLQYVHDFLVLGVISNFFKFQKSQSSRPGLPVYSHADFTYSFPKLKIILVPTKVRSNHFSCITLIARTASPPYQRHYSYMWHRPTPLS